MARPNQPPPGVAPRERMPALADRVLVTTREAIGGQREHAAIVTRVVSDKILDVLVMPAGAQPYPVTSVGRESTGGLFWRFPPN